MYDFLGPDLAGRRDGFSLDESGSDEACWALCLAGDPDTRRGMVSWLPDGVSSPGDKIILGTGSLSELERSTSNSPSRLALFGAMDTCAEPLENTVGDE